MPEMSPRSHYARVMVQLRAHLKAHPWQHPAGFVCPADVDHGARQPLYVFVEHEPGAGYALTGGPVDHVATWHCPRSGQEPAWHEAAKSRDVPFVAERVAPAAFPEWVRCEALPAEHVRIEHAVALAHAENRSQEVDHFFQFGLGYRRDQRPTPLEASTAFSFPTLLLSTVSSILNFTPNSSSQAIMSLTCARLSHSGMVSGESPSERTSLSFSMASRKIC